MIVVLTFKCSNSNSNESLPEGTHEWVDKLSLVISLREDSDARVEGEVLRVINEIEWKD